MEPKQTESVQALKFYQSGRYEDALKLYTTSLDQLSCRDNTTRIATLFNRSLCHTKLKRYELALNDYREILELDGKNGRTNKKNIKTLCHLGRYQEAFAAATRWKTLDPDCQHAQQEVDRLAVIVSALSQDIDSDDDDAVTLMPDESSPPNHADISSPDFMTSQNGLHSPTRDTFEGVTLPSDGTRDKYQCTYCDTSFATQADLRTHCRSDLHKERIVCDGKENWLYRNPPRGLTGEEYTKCPRVDGETGCRLGNKCPQAHSDEELSEWKDRFEYKKQLLQKARENELHGGTCAERLLEKWMNSDEPGSVMTDSVPGVKIYVNSDLKMSVSTKRCCHAWLCTVTTRLHLYRVVLLNESNQAYFQISSITIGPKRSQKPQKLEDVCQEWINPGTPLTNSKNETVYRVKVLFRTDIFGTFRQVVVFDFGREPYLRQDLCVESSPVMAFEKLQEEVCSVEDGKWDADAENIVKFEPAPLFPSKSDLALLQQYPMPTAAQVRNFSCLEAANTTQENYKDRMHSLLAIEEMAQFSNISKYNVNTQLCLTDKYMLTPSPNSTAKFSSGGQLFAQMTLTKDVSEDTACGRLILQNVSHVLIAPADGDKEPEKVYEAIVEDKGKTFIFLRLSAKCTKDLDLKPDTKFDAQIQFQLNRVPLCEMHESVDKLLSPALVFPDVTVRPEIHDLDTPVDTRFGRSLNEKQREAVVAISAEGDLPPVVIVGPYGTGKTFTLAQATFQIMRDPEARVLICCHSNSAADLYIRDYFHAHPEGEDGWRPVRIVYKYRWMTTFDDVVLQYCLKVKEGRETTFKYPDVVDLEKHRVVVTTCNMTRCLHDLNLPQGFFTHILIDEAAQALESELLIPISLGDASTRLVLAGDYMQMSPEVHSDYARQCDFHTSLLERLVDLYPNNHPCKIMLCENYRSDQAIISFMSELFYDGRLLAKGVQLPHEKFYPLTFFTARGEDIQHRNSTNFHNDAEVYEVAERVSEIQKAWPKAWGDFDAGSIGVVSPYADQVVRIRSELRKRKLAGVSVERVFNVQGKQFRVIILSTVRTRHTCSQAEDLDYGFLSNTKVLNTALTRAQSLVGVVGDPISLCTLGKCRKIWEEYLNICHKNGSLYGISWNQLRAHLDGLELKKTYVLNPLAPEFIPNRLRHGPLPVYSNQYCPVAPPTAFNMPVRPPAGMIYNYMPHLVPQMPPYANLAPNMAMAAMGYGYGMPWLPRYINVPYCPPQTNPQPIPQQQPQQQKSSPGRHRSLSGDSVFAQNPLHHAVQGQAIEKQRRPSTDGKYPGARTQEQLYQDARRTTVPPNVQPQAWGDPPVQQNVRPKRISQEHLQPQQLQHHLQQQHQQQQQQLLQQRLQQQQSDSSAITGSPNLRREFYDYLVSKDGVDKASKVMDEMVNESYEGRPLFKRNPVTKTEAALKQGVPLVQPGPPVYQQNPNGMIQKDSMDFERRRHGSSSSVETRQWNVDQTTWSRNVQKPAMRNPLSDYHRNIPPPPLPQGLQPFPSNLPPQKSKSVSGAHPSRSQVPPHVRSYLDQDQPAPLGTRDWRYQNLINQPNDNAKPETAETMARYMQIAQSMESINDSDSEPSGAATASSSQNSVFFSNDVEQHDFEPDQSQPFSLYSTSHDRRRHMSAPQRFHSSGETPPAGSFMDDRSTPVEQGWERRSFGRNSLSQLTIRPRSSPQSIPSPHLDLEVSSSFGENSFQNRPVADTPDKDIDDPLNLLRNLNIRSSPGTEAFYNYLLQ